MKFIYVIIFLLTALLASAKYKFIVNVKPGDALLMADDMQVYNNKLFTAKTKKIELVCKRWGYKEFAASFTCNHLISAEKINVSLEPEKYKIIIDVINGKSGIEINGRNFGLDPVEAVLPYGSYKMKLTAPDYPEQECILNVNGNEKLQYKLLKINIPIKLMGIYKCRSQPKQVLFSPDDSCLFIPLLHDSGFDVFDLNKLQMKTNVNVPYFGGDTGFAEGLFFEKNNAFLVSQMTTGKVFEFSADELKLLRTFDSHGTWSKFMAKSEMLGVFAVSNWASNDISIMNYTTGELINKINTDPAPRGLAFDSRSEFLYATTFEGGTVLKISTNGWKIKNKLFYKDHAAMRHIVLTGDDSRAYVADMFYSQIHEIDTALFVITKSYNVDFNPNTISLTPDNRYLFVSSRGPNDSETYLKRSPRNGLISVIDLKEGKVIYQFEGGNQPTGLAVSHSGKYLSFTNFRDDTFELYYIGEL